MSERATKTTVDPRSPQSNRTSSGEIVPENAPELQLPDLQFGQLCESRFGINRGVYNTVEAMLYTAGISDIVTRRRTLLSFLAFAYGVNPADGNGPMRRKLGPGGLRMKWQEYRAKHAARLFLTHRK